MFVLKKGTSFKWPVSFSMPGDGGVQEEHSFDAEFKQLPQSRINKIREEAPRRQKEIDEGLAIYEDLERTAVDQSFKDMSSILFILNAIDHRSSDELIARVDRLTLNSSWN